MLPTLPRRDDGEDWPATSVALWEAWRQDPVTAQWSPADVAYALETIRLHAVMTSNSANEVRIRMDGLGLTPKGKRDLRWRATAANAAKPAREKPAEVRKLRAV